MPSTNPADLLAIANCFQCIPEGSRALVKLSLLAQILKSVNAVATIDVQSLLNSASCFQCVPAGQQSLLELVMLSDILVAGSIGTGACLLCGAGPPVNAPASSCCLFMDNVSSSPNFGSLYAWDVDNGAWFPIISGS